MRRPTKKDYEEVRERYMDVEEAWEDLQNDMQAFLDGTPTWQEVSEVQNSITTLGNAFERWSKLAGAIEKAEHGDQ